MTDAVVQREDDLWLPGPLAFGPFGGLHGGVIGGCLVTAMDEVAADAGGGTLAVFSVHLLRPAPPEPFSITAAVVRSGRRTRSLAASLEHGGREIARATAVYVSATEIPGLAVPPQTAADPESLPRVADAGLGDGPWNLDARWFWQAFEVRVAPDETFWARPLLPLVAGAPTTAMVVAIADWPSGLFRSDRHGPRRVASWPNAELTVHLARPAAGIDDRGWIGVSGESAWNDQGWGFTGATLRDANGLLARSAQACVLTAVEAADERA